MEDLQCCEQPNSADVLNTLNNVFLSSAAAVDVSQQLAPTLFVSPIITDRLCLKRPSALTGAEQQSSRALLGQEKQKNIALSV